VIFADVRLQPSDEAPKLKKLGLPLLASRPAAAGARFPQPCAALEGCRCRIYGDRPTYCREFECLLLKRVQAEQMDAAAALSLIRTARARAEKVRCLLAALGDNDQKIALSLRFQRMSRQLERITKDDAATDLFSQLTLAVHDLNLLIGQEFYPGPS